MGMFAGIVRFDGGPIDPRSEERLTRAVAAQQKAKIDIRRSAGALFVQRATPAVMGGLGPQQLLAGNGGETLFASHVRLDNCDEIAAALAVPPSERAEMPDAALLMHMLERWGDAGVARCLGAFAFARWEAGARRLTLARDCLGNCPLLFHRNGPFLAFSNVLGLLLALPEVPREIDDVAVAHFLASNWREPDRTLYRGIARTPSRTIVTADAAGIRHRIYWSPDFDAPPPYRRDEDYIERARELFDQAVAAASADCDDIAISLSGGLDSSAIAATVARLGRAKRITCYTMVPPADFTVDPGPDRYLNEADKVRALARMYPALNVQFLSPEGPHPVDDDDNKYFTTTSLPALGLTQGWTAVVRDVVRAAGQPVLLVGTRGDLGLSWHGQYSLLHLLRDGNWARLARELPPVARANGDGLAWTFLANVIMPAAPAPVRRLFHRLRGRDPDSVARYSVLNPAFIAEAKLSQAWQSQGFDPWYRASGWSPARHRAEWLFDHALASRDNLYWIDGSHGYDVRDPHSDRRLLEFALSVPEPMYRRDGVPRSFARAVFADRLPPEIVTELRRGGGGGPWFRRLNMRRHDMAADIERLEASATARKILDLPRLKTLLDEWPQDEYAAQKRMREYRVAFARGIHVGRFIRWVEGGNM